MDLPGMPGHQSRKGIGSSFHPSLFRGEARHRTTDTQVAFPPGDPRVVDKHPFCIQRVCCGPQALLPTCPCTTGLCPALSQPSLTPISGSGPTWPPFSALTLPGCQLDTVPAPPPFLEEFSIPSLEWGEERQADSWRLGWAQKEGAYCEKTEGRPP